MFVQLYRGNYNTVKKSGVGKAILHQEQMLQSVGVPTSHKWSAETDIVHINTVLPDAVFHALRAKIAKKHVVYYGHSTMDDFKHSFKGSTLFAPLFKSWITFCYNLGDVILTPTEYSQKILESYPIKKPIYAISNGIDTEFFAPHHTRREAFRQTYQLTKDDKVVISVGHWIERKGVLDFINLARAMPHTKFIWFGHTNLNLVPKHIATAIANAPENLHFAGYVEKEALRDAYCGADVFAFMSYEETEGIVVLEALACQIDTVVRDIGVYDGWLCDGETVYKAKNNNDFQERVSSLLERTCPSLKIQGHAVAKARTLDSMGEKLLHIYQTEGFSASSNKAPALAHA